MVDASTQSYGNFLIDKRIVLLGPGFCLGKNNIIAEGAEAATFDKIEIIAEATVVKSVAASSQITVAAHKVVVNRCFVKGPVYLRNASNSIISQNRITGMLEGYGSSYVENYIQATNNLISGRISCLHNSYIAYNTISSSIFSCKDCTVNNNWGTSDVFKNNSNDGNSFNDNYVSTDYRGAISNTNYGDGDAVALEVDEGLRSTYGAFAGDAPYVLSGVPAGPIVQELIVPTTVEQGNKLQVTIKVGIQQ